MRKPRSIKYKYKGFHIFDGVKRTLFRASLDNEPKRKIFKGNPWKLDMKAKSILAIAIIVIMLVSVFAWLSTGTQSKPSNIQPVSNHPTATPPSPSQQTPNQTRTDILSNLASMLTGVASGASTTVAP